MDGVAIQGPGCVGAPSGPDFFLLLGRKWNTRTGRAEAVRSNPPVAAQRSGLINRAKRSERFGEEPSRTGNAQSGVSVNSGRSSRATPDQREPASRENARRGLTGRIATCVVGAMVDELTMDRFLQAAVTAWDCMYTHPDKVTGRTNWDQPKGEAWFKFTIRVGTGPEVSGRKSLPVWPDGDGINVAGTHHTGPLPLFNLPADIIKRDAASAEVARIMDKIARNAAGLPPR